MVNNDQNIINEILNFNPAELVGLDKLTDEKKDEFNNEVISNLIKRILYIVVGKLKDNPEKQEWVLGMLKDEKNDLAEIFDRLSEEVEGLGEIVLNEFLKIKSEITNNN